MNDSDSLHPDNKTLNDYGLGKLDDKRAAMVDSHLEACPGCRQRVSGITSDSFLGQLRDAQMPATRGFREHTVAASDLSMMTGKNVSAPPATDALPTGLAEHPDYEIKRELGRGGMGVVYLAHNSMMGRDEVLKVLGRQVMERPGVFDRFQREIRAVARLRHPNIVTAYSAFRIQEGLVFAMEYVEGLDLSKLVKTKGPLSVAHAAYFTHQAALGLQHAHERGMVHRDIKPHNLMLTHDGKARLIKVLDFGLAKAALVEKVDGGLTTEGQALGTPDYIAPEQILDASTADIRADLYSLGGTLFYLLTGRPPFQATSLYDMYQAHISRDAEPLNLIRPEVPTELAALASKLMAKDPNKRFQTPAEVAQALMPFFKKVTAGFNPELSNSKQPDPPRSATVVEPLPTRRSTTARGQAPTPENYAPASPNEKLWEHLIDAGESDRSDSSTGPLIRKFAPPRRAKPRWVLPTTAAGLMFVSLLIAGGFIISFKSKDREVVLQDPPPGTVLTVEPDRVHIVTGGSEPVNVPAVQPIAAKTGETTPLHDETSTRVARLAALLDKTIPMHYVNDTPISDVVKDIKNASRGPDGSTVPIYVDPQGLQEADRTMASTIAIDLDGLPLKHTLRLTLKQVGLDYCTRDGLLFISAIEMARQESSRGRDVPSNGAPENKAVLAALEMPIPMNHPTDTPLADVVNNLKKVLKAADGSAIPIYVDPSGLVEADKTMASTIAIDLEGLPLRDTLHLLLKQVGMDYFVKDGLLSISDRKAVLLVSGGAGERGAATPVLASVDSPAVLPAMVDSGTWRVEGEELIQNDGQGTILLGDKLLSSYDLTFQGQIVTGTEGFVVLFHRTDDENGRFFHVGEDSGTRVDLGAVFKGKEQVGKSSSITIAQGRWYEVLLKVRGSEVWCFLAGKEVYHDKDQRFTTGRIGLATWAADARYRNIVVTTPDGKPLWSGLPKLSAQATPSNPGSPMPLAGKTPETLAGADKAVKKPQPRDPKSSRIARLAETLEKRIPMHHRNTPLSDFVNEIRKATRGPDGSLIPIYVDPLGVDDADKTMDSPVRIDLEGVALRESLRLALKPLGLAYCVKEGLLFISGPEFIQRESSRGPRVLNDGTPASKAVLAALENSIPIKFPKATSIQDLTNYLSRTLKRPNGTGVPIHVDPIGLADADRTMNSTVRLDLEGVPLRLSLRMALQQLWMDYYIKDGILIISNHEKFPQHLR